MHDPQAFEQHRSYMFAIAYRMLGSVGDAEDIVQETWLRYQSVAPEQIVSLKALLSTIVTRLCLNRLQSAQAQREQYIGPWLPEPILTEQHVIEQVSLHESITMAFLVVLEQLTPLERAVFLLHDVFDYSYGELANMLGRDEAACRQLSSRARKHIAARRPRFKHDPDSHRDMLQGFLQAVEHGDLDGLLRLLADDVTLWADGGGKVRGAAQRPLHGADAVARFLLASPRLVSEPLQSVIAKVNGESSLLLHTNGVPRLVLGITVENGQIVAVRAIGNPDKLQTIRIATDEHGRNDDG